MGLLVTIQTEPKAFRHCRSTQKWIHKILLGVVWVRTPCRLVGELFSAWKELLLPCAEQWESS